MSRSIAWLRGTFLATAMLIVTGFGPPVGAARCADAETEQLKERVAELEIEVKQLKERLAALERKALPEPRKLKLKVIAGGWGDASTDNIEAVCRSAANEFIAFFPNREPDSISIRFDGKRGPMVSYGKGADDERRVLLNATDAHWAQFAFQFAHEFCHIFCNYREANRVNLWFEESLCETASLFALRRMAETWKTRPPYSNWKSYAPSLASYAETRIKEVEKLDGQTFAQWYQRNEPELRKTGVNRQKNQVVAVALLPLLEKDPKHWQAMRFLNQWDAKKDLSFADYLRHWRERVPAEHKAFVADVAGLFDIKTP